MATNPPPPFRPFQQCPERAFDSSTARPDPKTALVFVDTNVLLAPYKASSEALSAIETTFGQLRGQSRLIVPAQVAREFAFNRPNLVAQLHKVVSDSRSISVNGRLEGVPILVGAPEYTEAQTRLSEMQASLKGFRAAIDKLVDRIESWERADPVLQVYSKLLTADVVKDLAMDATQLEAHRKSRFDAKVPPGFRDKTKDDGGVGDLAIWFTILEISEKAGRDAILITEDSKDDWFHRSGDRRLFPRYELVAEFGERTGGRAFGMDSLSSLLKQYGASEEVVREVRETESTSWAAPTIEPILRFQRAHELVLRRLRQVGMDLPITLEVRRNAPDIVINVGGEILALQIISVTGPNYRKRAVEATRRAVEARKEEDFKEVVMLFVSDPGDSRSVEHWLAEETFFGPGISTAAAVATDNSLLVHVNNAAHPLFRMAFPVAST